MVQNNSDGKLKLSSVAKYTLSALGVVALGSMIFLNFDNIAKLVQQQASPIINALTPTLTQITQTWNSIPNEIKSVVFVAIPTAFTLFFAWTKSRAMKKLAQTQQEASKTISNLQGQKQMLQSELTTLQQQPKTVDLSSTVASLQNDLKTLETNKNKEIQTLITQKNTLQYQLDKLQSPTITCRNCGTLYPAYLAYCPNPTCQTPQLVTP